MNLLLLGWCSGNNINHYAEPFFRQQSQLFVSLSSVFVSVWPVQFAVCPSPSFSYPRGQASRCVHVPQFSYPWSQSSCSVPVPQFSYPRGNQFPVFHVPQFFVSMCHAVTCCGPCPSCFSYPRSSQFAESCSLSFRIHVPVSFMCMSLSFRIHIASQFAVFLSSVFVIPCAQSVCSVRVLSFSYPT